MNRDEATYGNVGQKYDEWVEIQKSKPTPQRALPEQRPYIPEPGHGSSDMTKVFAAIGVGIGLMLLGLAVASFVVAGKWAGLGRESAATGYTIVGFFLVVASTGGILATLNHNFRVLKRPGGHH